MTFRDIIYTPKKLYKSKIILYWRIDTDISTVPSVVLIDRLVTNDSSCNYDWITWMRIRDFIMTQSQLHNIFPNYENNNMAAIDSSKLFPVEIIEESRNYLMSLGFIGKSKFSVRNNELFYNGKLIDTTRTEIKLIDCLIKSVGSLVSFDNLSKAMWGLSATDKFSLNAITKMIQLIRKKLVANGIKAEVIKTVRGKGYKLLV